MSLSMSMSISLRRAVRVVRVRGSKTGVSRSQRRPMAEAEPIPTRQPSVPALPEGVRADRVAAAKAKLASGAYDDPDVLDAAVTRMIDTLK